ncbi:succinyl-CoA:mesaconate CoA transferase [Myxococcaceae bacterium]|jgi:crotonobetainyl-CoA:carnitine CoA-transferase CaiB-like acyl-CoA transferase|nr:succinyl-CoA:mesaconate CoA transferase [Myxococcaceae bacterium]
MAGRALEGVRVLDLTRVVAGPFATAILADLGADVVKVERPATGDDYRYGPSRKGETSLSFQNTNRGKRSITLDVATPEGRELLLRLAERFDVLVENFRAGWLASRGLGPDVLAERNPRLVVASLSGFGATGPLAGSASYDIVAQAAGGLLAMTGPEDGPPVRGGGALADFVGGLYLAVGVLAALRDRDRTGRARSVDLSNQDAIFAVTDSAATIYAGLGVRSGRVGNQHPFTAPYDAFETRDGFVAIGTASNKLFRRLCDAIGRPELASDERFRSHRVRASNRRELNDLVAAWTRERSSAEVMRTLGPQGADLPCAPVAAPEDLLDDPQLVARGMIERVAHPRLGEIVFHGNPIRLSGAEPRVRSLAPELGEDNEAVYAEIGIGRDELTRLRAAGVI